MVPAIQKMLPKVDSILGSVNSLLADPALRTSLHNVEGITTNLTTTSRELNQLLAQANGALPTVGREGWPSDGQCQRRNAQC